MNADTVLEIRNLSVRFKNTTLIQDLSFALKKGERASLTGKSGSGKTSLLRCILGFSLPASGGIFIKGEELTEKTVWSLRREIGFVPQEPDLGNQVVERLLELPFHFKSNRNRYWDENRILELLHIFHLEEDILHKKTTLLSGGEKQRIALISALLLERGIYLLDEVTSALDDETRKAVVDYLLEREDLSFLFVTHDRDIKAKSHWTHTLVKRPGIKADR